MDMKRINGHIVLDDMPAELLIVTRSEIDNNVAVRVMLHNDKISDGNMCIYVHGTCCLHRGGKEGDARFDVVLIDDQYKAFYNDIDPETNQVVRYVSNPPISSQEIWQMAQDSKKRWEKMRESRGPRQHRVYKKGPVLGHEIEPYHDVGDNILRAEYIRNEHDPIGLEKFW